VGHSTHLFQGHKINRRLDAIAFNISSAPQEGLFFSLVKEFLLFSFFWGGEGRSDKDLQYFLFRTH